jgi:hypothetical protein
VGQLVTLNVSAVNGSGPYGYQWRKNGVDIQGATSASYSFTAYMEDNANFDVVVTNEFTPAGVNSNVVSLVVAEPIADVIASISPTSNVTPGTSVTFSVSATGTGPYFYQWRKGGIEIQFATSATYNIPSVAESDSGDYDVVVSNAVGSVTSATVPLSVTP